MNDDTQSKQKRPRSPSYPSISLGKAVERAEVIYKHEGKYLAPIDSILAHWGYTARGGRALRQLAALKKFGLTIEEGRREDRQIKLSQLGLYIVMPDSPERAESLKKAAMTPTIHKELQAKYPEGLPSDSTVRWYLKSERQFTEKAASELVAEYQATMRFAGLDGVSAGAASLEESEDTDVSNGDEEASQDEDMADDTLIENPSVPPTPPKGAKGRADDAMRDVSIPLAGTAWVTVSGEFPMTEESWDQMLAMLAAMKPGLTQNAG